MEFNSGFKGLKKELGAFAILGEWEACRRVAQRMTLIMSTITCLEEYPILSTKSEAQILACTVLELGTSPRVIRATYHRNSCQRRYCFPPLEQRNPTWVHACKTACQKISSQGTYFVLFMFVYNETALHLLLLRALP